MNEQKILLSESEYSQIEKSLEQSYIAATNIFELITLKNILNKLGVKIDDWLSIKTENEDKEETDVKEKGCIEKGSLLIINNENREKQKAQL